LIAAIVNLTIFSIAERYFFSMNDCALITRMYFNDQLPYREIADILQLSRKTVEAQIAIATQKIKEIFEKRRWNR